MSTLAEFTARHGVRVRRGAAMAILNIRDKGVFKKVVDANPNVKHRLSGEGQCKYLTEVLYGLLHPAASVPREGKTENRVSTPKA